MQDVCKQTTSIGLSSSCVMAERADGGRPCRYRVRLSAEERAELSDCDWKHAHMLLLADEDREDGGRTDADIASVLGVGASTVERVRIGGGPRRWSVASRCKPRKLDGAGEAKLVRRAMRDAAPRRQARGVGNPVFTKRQFGADDPSNAGGVCLNGGCGSLARRHRHGRDLLRPGQPAINERNGVCS